MSTSRPSTAQRRAELRAQMDAIIQEHREQPLPRWLSSRRHRRALALAPAVTFALGVVAAGLRDHTAGLALMAVATVVAVGGTLELRRATRMLDNAPASLLDEREVGERDQAYRRSFQHTMSLMAVLLVLAFTDALLTKFTPAALITGDGWMHLMLASFLTVSMLPAAALAWSWAAPEDDADDADD